MDRSAHSPSFPSLHLRHSSFSNPPVVLPTSQLILQPFRCFTYVTAHSPTLLSLLQVTGSSLTSPGEPPMTLSYYPLKLWTALSLGLNSSFITLSMESELYRPIVQHRKYYNVIVRTEFANADTSIQTLDNCG